MSLRFVLCIEAGRLEPETLLLCESIRQFGGALADSPISAYRPREGADLDAETRTRLGSMGVEIVDEPVNRDHSFHPTANKPLAAAHAAENCSEDVLVVCDADSVFVAAPTALALGPDIDAAVAPVGKVGDGSTGPDHENEPYWERLYELAEAEGRPFAKAALRGRLMRAYWNAGLVALRRDTGLPGVWRDLTVKLLDLPHLPQRGGDAVDQLSLAGVLAREPDRVATLPPTYNFRITRRGNHRGDPATYDLTDVVHVHYMRSFHVPGFLESLDPPLDRESEQYRWLAERLPVQPEIVVGDDGEEPITWQQIRGAATGQLERRPVDMPPGG